MITSEYKKTFKKVHFVFRVIYLIIFNKLIKGPAQTLFQDSYYELLKNALRPNGIVCCQGIKIYFQITICIYDISLFKYFKGENFWNFSDLVSKIIGFAGKIFPSVSYAQTQIPSYPTGCIGFILCSLEDKKNFSTPIHKFDCVELDKLELKYYSTEMHSASFVLPTSFQKVI